MSSHSNHQDETGLFGHHPADRMDRIRQSLPFQMEARHLDALQALLQEDQSGANTWYDALQHTKAKICGDHWSQRGYHVIPEKLDLVLLASARVRRLTCTIPTGPIVDLEELKHAAPEKLAEVGIPNEDSRLAMLAANETGRKRSRDGLLVAAHALLPTGLLSTAKIIPTGKSFCPYHIWVKDMVFAAQRRTIAEMASTLATAPQLVRSKGPNFKQQDVVLDGDTPLMFVQCIGSLQCIGDNDVVYFEAVDFGSLENLKFALKSIEEEKAKIDRELTAQREEWFEFSHGRRGF